MKLTMENVMTGITGITGRNLLQEADNVIILAGAGMSADLGVPTYWTGDDAKYANKESKYGFTSLEHSSAPLWETHPVQQSQYFQALYRQMLDQKLPDEATNPYLILKNWLDTNGKNYFVVTSNVDTTFRRNSYEPSRLYEIHGAYDRSQCLLNPSAHGVFPTMAPHIAKTLCPQCRGIVRPNVLFFHDIWFNSEVHDKQEDLFFDFQDSILSHKTVLLEIGVGLTVLNLRNITRKLYRRYDTPLVRVNPFHIAMGDHIATGKSPIMEYKMTAADGVNFLLQQDQRT